VMGSETLEAVPAPVEPEPPKRRGGGLLRRRRQD
jgi:hypothetical protein